MDLPCLSTPNTLMVSKSQRILFHLSKVRNIFIDLISVYISIYLYRARVVCCHGSTLCAEFAMKCCTAGSYRMYRFCYNIYREIYSNAIVLEYFFIINIDVGGTEVSSCIVCESNVSSCEDARLYFWYVWSAVPTY